MTPKILFVTCLDFVADQSERFHCADCHKEMAEGVGTTKCLYRPTPEKKLRKRSQKHAHVVAVMCCTALLQAHQAGGADLAGSIMVWADVARRVRRQVARPC